MTKSDWLLVALMLIAFGHFWRMDAIKRDLMQIKEKLGLSAPDKHDY